MSTAENARLLSRLDEHREQVTLPLAISDAERAAWIDWFRVQGMDPDHIVQNHPFTVDDAARTITVLIYDTNEAGLRYRVDPDGAAVTRLVVHQLEARPLPWPALPPGVRYLGQEAP